MNREITEVILSGIGLGAAYLAFHNSIQFTGRTLDEVVGFLRHLNWNELNELFDPSVEERLVGCWTSPRIRRSQRARLDKAREFLERMDCDNRLFFQWASTEYKDMRSHHLQYDPETVGNILQLIETTRRFRRIALVVMCKIKFYSLLNFDKFRFLPIPSVSGLRHLGDADLLHAFFSVRSAALALASVYGEEYEQEIAGTI